MGGSSFSKHDLEMIEISWAFVKDKQELGLNTMIGIFNTSKETKKMFKFANNLKTVTEIKQNVMTCNHAKQVIDIFDKIILLLTQSSSINDEDKDKLVELGQIHYHFGLKMEHFKLFENCFINSLEESLNINLLFKAKFEMPWRKLIQYIFKKYTHGMNYEEMYDDKNLMLTKLLLY